MSQGIKGLLDDELVRSFSLNAVATLIKLLASFVVVKVVSVVVGPDGLALLGQLTNFSAVLLTFATAGISTGVTKYVSEYSTIESRLRPLLQTSVYITAISSLVCGFVLVLGSGFFSRLILRTERFHTIFIIFGFTVASYAFNNLLLSTLNGFREFRKFAFITAAASLIGLAFSVGLVVTFGLYGALISVVTFQSVTFVFGLFITSRSNWFRWDFFFGRFSRSEASKLGHYSLMALVSGLADPASQLILRSYLMSQTSLSEAGLWEAANRASGVALAVIETSLVIYYLPKLATLDTTAELRNEVVRAFKLTAPVLLIIILAIFLPKTFIIQVLFDEKFIGMETLLVYQLSGDFLRICSWILAYVMVAKAMTKTFIASEILFSLTFVLFGVTLVPLYGGVGAAMGYALNYLIYFVAMLIVFRKLVFN